MSIQPRVTRAAIKTVHDHAGLITYVSMLCAYINKGERIEENYRWLDAAIISFFVSPVIKTATAALLNDTNSNLKD